jgi:AGCS family alanine or glycine:cation symporter
MGSFLFWDPFEAMGIYDPVVYADMSPVVAKGATDDDIQAIYVMKWYQPDGAKVTKGEKLALVRRNSNDTLSVFAKASGTLKYLHTAGEKVYDEDGVSAMEHGTLGEIGQIVFDKPMPVLNKNGDPVKKNIPFIVVWLVLGAIFFTIKMNFINIRGFKHAIQLVAGKFENPNDKGEVSHFQALTTALSATVGLGNIAGVAVAIVIGGPGATFWMIVAGLLGMASKFVECTLGLKYRKIDENGVVSGGPMYYLSEGLKKQGKKGLGKVLAVIFAILCVGGSFGGGNMFQANQAFVQVSSKIPFFADNGALFGVILAILVGLVILGGIKSIARVTDKIVPIMVGVYVGFAIIIILIHIENIGVAFEAIVQGAFSPTALKGGVIGVLIVGFQRAAFSNEAGVGSASIAHSASKTEHPVSEGIVALLEPFIDTVVVCTMTALVLIFTGFANDPGGLNGSELTSAAFSSVFSWFDWVLLVAIILFAFSTMISWSYYGLKAWSYLVGSSKKWEYVYKLVFLVFIVIGSSVGLGAVLDFSDLMILGMAFPNILGLFLLSGEVRKDLKAYMTGIKNGTIKRFK